MKPKGTFSKFNIVYNSNCFTDTAAYLKMNGIYMEKKLKKSKKQ